MSGLKQLAFYPCEKVRDLMIDYLEDKLPSFKGIRFHLHLNTCAQCREYLILYRKAANASTFRKEDPHPEECLESVLRFLAQRGIGVSGDPAS